MLVSKTAFTFFTPFRALYSSDTAGLAINATSKVINRATEKWLKMNLLLIEFMRSLLVKDIKA
jgi:hypothetical protein